MKRIAKVWMSGKDKQYSTMVIPKEIVKSMDIKPNQYFTIESIDNGLLLKKLDI